MKLIDVSTKTMIGLLPQIINYNNNKIKKILEDLLIDTDDVNAGIKVGINDSSSSHKANIKVQDIYGRSISVDEIKLNNEDRTDVKDKLSTYISHDKVLNRYYDTNGVIKDVSALSKDTSYYTTFIVPFEKYAHNSYAIGCNSSLGVLTLQYIIDNFDTRIKALENNKNPEMLSYGSNSALGTPNSFTFDKSTILQSKTQIQKMNLPMFQYNDIVLGKIYTYYYPEDNTVTVSDENIASIEAEKGYKVAVNFNNTKLKAYYRIILSRKDQKVLRVSKDELVRLTLICKDQTPMYGSEWDVLMYSIRDKEDLVIE